MSIEKLKRVMWRLQELGSIDLFKFHEHYLREAIMHEIGTDEETIKYNIAKLVELGWLKRIQKRTWMAKITPSEL